MSTEITSEQVLALLLNDPESPEGPGATALVCDPVLGYVLRDVMPDREMIMSARVTGRPEAGKAIIDPHTREVIGYELSPLAVA